MCDGGISAATIAAYASAAAAAAGTAMQYQSSKQQSRAAADAQLAETKRQGDVMAANIRAQEAQRQEAEKARDAFKQETLPAFTKKTFTQDANAEQARLQSALTAAGQKAIVPATGGASPSGNVTTSGTPGARDTSAGYRSALGAELGNVAAFSAGQSRAQAAMAALNRARQIGALRLQNAGQAIDLASAKTDALSRIFAANGLYSDASSDIYGVEAERAANKGAGLGLAGQGLSTLGTLGYGYASGYGQKN